MLQPIKTKYSKYQKGRVRGVATKGNTLVFGSYGLQTTKPIRLKAVQIESARKAIMKKIKKVGKLWIRVFPHTPVSSKPVGVRMGKGKGSNDYWVAKLREGAIIFELECSSFDVAKQALELAQAKLPIKTKIIRIK